MGWKDTTHSSATRIGTIPRSIRTAVAFGYATSITKEIPGYTVIGIWLMRYGRWHR